MAEAATLMDSYTEMTELLLPNDTNDLGRALGGAVMHWMDLCGVVAAMRFAETTCVTAASEGVEFISPIELGEVAVVEAYVYDAGDTSVEVSVEVRAEDPRTGDERPTATSFFTYVAVDGEGRPTAVPALETPTENQQALRREAVNLRREQLAEAAAKLED
jgi:acyl-CoA hydrolase